MPEASATSARPRSGNRRDETARVAVLHAADDLLVELGFRGLTVEAIARRAGVAKQTIYRWWPSKVDILLDTLIADAAKRLPVPVGEPTQSGLRRYVRDVAAFLSTDPAGAVWLTLVAEARHDSDTAAKFHERFEAPRRDAERDLLVRATADGVITPVLPPELALDMLWGPLVYRALAGADSPRRFVQTLVDTVLRPNGPPTPR